MYAACIVATHKVVIVLVTYISMYVFSVITFESLDIESLSWGDTGQIHMWRSLGQGQGYGVKNHENTDSHNVELLSPITLVLSQVGW